MGDEAACERRESRLEGCGGPEGRGRVLQGEEGWVFKDSKRGSQTGSLRPIDHRSVAQSRPVVDSGGFRADLAAGRRARGRLAGGGWGDSSRISRRQSLPKSGNQRRAGWGPSDDPIWDRGQAGRSKWACIGLVTGYRLRHLSPAVSPGWAGDPAYVLYNTAGKDHRYVPMSSTVQYTVPVPQSHIFHFRSI